MAPQNLGAETERALEVFHLEFGQFLERMNNRVLARNDRELALNKQFEDYAQWLDRELLGVLGLNVFGQPIGTAPIVQFSPRSADRPAL